MKKSSRYLIYCLAVILLVTICIFTVININKNKDSKKSEVLYKYFGTGDLETCNGLFNYSDKLITEKDIDNDTKICLAYNKTNTKDSEKLTLEKDKKALTCTKDKMKFRVNDDEKECTYTKISKDKVNKTYKMIFGSNIDKDVKSFQIDNTHICYVKEDNIYCGLKETFTYVLGDDINVYRVIKNIEEKSSELILYEYFIRIVDDNCYSYYTTDEVNKECNNNYNKNIKVKYRFIKKYGTLYKHVFEKDGNEFHWVSSEPIKK